MERRSILKAVAAAALVTTISLAAGPSFAQDKKFTIALIPA
jgi:ribose transport system substrate-binding protein